MGIAKATQFLENRLDILYEVLVHDQLAAVGLAIEAEVIDVDPAQLLGRDRATRVPARAEVDCGDRVDVLRGRWLRWCRGGALHEHASRNGHYRQCAEPLGCAYRRRVHVA